MNIETVLPEEVGIPASAIRNMLIRFDRKALPIHSLLLWRKGRLAFETTYAPLERGHLHRLFSITKTLTCVGIGLLADEGRLCLDDPIVKYFPDKCPEQTDPLISAMTIRDMLMMKTCHASTTYKLDMKSDWVESFFTTKPTHPAGTVFHYDTSAAHVMAALVERLSGKELLTYVREKLAPLGLDPRGYVLRDPFDSPIGGSGWVGTTEDLLRFGIFLLQKGEIDGQQLLSRDFLGEMLTLHSSSVMTAPIPGEACGYGYQLWFTEQHTPMCYGLGGQFILLYPEQELIVVTTADTIGYAGGNQIIFDAVQEDLLPALDKVGSESSISAASSPASGHPEIGSKEPAPDKLARSLQENDLAMPIGDLGSALVSPLQLYVQGRVYALEENPLGFTDLQLSWERDAGTLRYHLKGEECILHFGMGRHITGRFPGYDQFYSGNGLWLGDGTLYLYFHIIDAYVGNVRMQFAFSDNSVTVFLKKNEESLFGEYNGHLTGVCK